MRTVFIALILIVSCASAQPILDYLSTAQNLTQLFSFASGEQAIVDFLNATADAKISLFAPTDQAFSAFTPGSVSVVGVLSYHGVNKTLNATGNVTMLVDSAYTPSTLNAAQKLKLVFENDVLKYVNGIPIISNISLSNGDVYTIGTVIPTPENLTIVANAANLTTVVTALTAVDLVSVLGSASGITVLAPNNDAFLKYDSSVITFLTTTNVGKELLTKVLKNHVIPALAYSNSLPSDPVTPLLANSSLTINSTAGTVNTYSNIVATDVFTSNGVVHVVDTIIVPEDLTLNELLAGLGLTSLSDALAQANLTATIGNTTNRFTLFAPTNAAFTAAGTVAPEALSGILLNHVLSGMIFSTDLMPTQTVMPLNSDTSLQITVNSGTVTINGNITVTIANQRAFNGVIHVIDQVITASAIVPPTTAAPVAPTTAAPVAPTTAAPVMPTMPVAPTAAPVMPTMPTMPVAPTSSALTMVFSAVLCAIVLALSL